MDAIGFGHVDDADLTLIVELLQQDCRDAVSAAIGKGKQIEGTKTDTQVAFDLLLEELQEVEVFSADRRMTRSIQVAIQVDGDAILRSQDEERVAEDDRSLSLSLSNKGQMPATQSHSQPSAPDDELLEKLASIYITGINKVESDDDANDDILDADKPETSSWAASRPGRRRSCDACGDRMHFEELSRAPCQHEYCRQCLGRLFQDAMIDESLFPPRCCKQPIPLDKGQIYLDTNVVRLFRQKALEFSTPNRTYCHDTGCGSFIPPSNFSGTTALCSDCNSQTCTACKCAAHDGDCPDDEQLQQVIQLAREQGWQRCQNCWGMVELDLGCNHMT
ncbi:hypothetical protein GGR57DRAFT_480191 [Xylariaceae sp. FL1272]|nr:hypothetical protein GGR57DRAFT_480191 [Xylariaceae sp. FL1272]